MEPQKQEPQQPEKPEGQAERLADKLLHGAYQVSRYVEIVLAILIIVVVAVLVVRMIADLFAGGFAALEVQNFTAFLANVLALVIGIEFVLMLCKHTPEMLIEVLAFSIARELIVGHLQTWETLIGIGGIGLLFLVRKHLLLKQTERKQLDDTF